MIYTEHTDNMRHHREIMIRRWSIMKNLLNGVRNYMEVIPPKAAFYIC